MASTLEQAFWAVAALLGKSAIVLATALVAAECCRRSASLRHAVRTAGMLAALLLPVATLLAPSWEWRILPAQASAEVAVAHQPAADTQAAARVPKGRHQHRVVVAKENDTSDLKLSATAEPINTVSTAVAGERTNWHWSQVLLFVWLAGAILLAARLSGGIVSMHRLLARAKPVRNGQWLSDVVMVAAELKIRRPVTLLECSEIEIPMTYGFFYPRLLLPGAAAAWEPARRRAVIYHELAHVLRLDSLTQLWASLAEVVYWVNPLVWIHSNRMRMERERACDDFVICHGARASEYANQLLEIAGGKEISAALALPMARRSQLKTRLLALLDPAIRRDSVSRSSLALLLATTFAILTVVATVQVSAAPAQTEVAPQAAAPAQSEVAPQTVVTAQSEAVPHAAATAQSEAASQAAAPAQPPQPSAPAAPRAVASKPEAPQAPPQPAPARDASACFASTTVHQRTSIHTDDDGTSKWDLQWSGDSCSVKVRAEGQFSFAADRASIENIASGGFFEASQNVGGHTRYIKVTPAQGQLQYSYSVDGERREFDPAARQWFSAFLVELQRVSPIDAPQRAAKLIQQGGADAILNEVGNIRSDYVTGIYLRTMLEKTQLTPLLLRRTLREAAPRIQSDYELGRLLTDISTRYRLDDEAIRADFLQASSRLHSDYERARVLMQLLQRSNLSAAIVSPILKSAGELHSDYEKARVLTALAEQKGFSEGLHAAYLQAASSIHSDYDRTRTLMALMSSKRLSTDSLIKLLEAIASIKSDYEKANVLTATARDYKMTGSLRSAYVRIASGISSDSERDRAMKALGATRAIL